MRFIFGSKSKPRPVAPEVNQVGVADTDLVPGPADSEVAATDNSSDDLELNRDTALSPAAATGERLERTVSSFAAQDGRKASDRSLYKGLLASLYDAVLIVDAKGYVIEYNHRAEEFFGYDKSELWNKPCADLISSVSLRVLAKLQEHSQTGRFTVVNTTCNCKDGSSFPAEIAINRMNLLPEGDLLFSIRNLRKRKKVDDGRELEDQALKHAGVGIAICDKAGLVKYANPAFVSILQYEKSEELLGVDISGFCGCPDDIEKLLLKNEGRHSWFGNLELSGAKGWKRRFIATSNMTGDEEDSDLTLTLTPVSRRIG